MDGRAEGERGGGIVGGGIVIGERAAERAAVADGGIADHAGERGERRDGLRTASEAATSAWVTAAPMVPFAGGGDALQLGEPADVDQVAGAARRCFMVGISVCPPAR